MKQYRILWTFILLLAFARHCFPTFASSMWCPHQGGIGGREDQQTRAEKFISGQTSSTNGLQIYVTADNQGLYLHSNLKLPETDGNISLNTDDPVDSFSFITAYLMNPKDDTLAYDNSFQEAYRKKVIFYVDQKLFNDAKYGGINFDDAEHVQIIGPDDQPRFSTILPKDNGDNERIVQLDMGNPNVFASAKQPDIIKSYLGTSALPFRRDNVKIISLVNDETFNTKLANTTPKEYIQYDRKSVQSLNDNFSLLHGKTVFIIGHIPDGSSDIDTGHFRIKIEELENTAEKNGIDLIVLGCNSKKYSEATGVLNNTIETLEILPQLSAALNAQTNGVFWNSIASSKLKLVVTQSIVDHQGKRRVAIDVYRADQFDGMTLVGTMVAVVSGEQSGYEKWKRWIFPAICVLIFTVGIRKIIKGLS